MFPQLLIIAIRYQCLLIASLASILTVAIVTHHIVVNIGTSYLQITSLVPILAVAIVT